MSLNRTRQPNPIRAALQAAMLSPRAQAAVSVFVNVLVDEGEAILRERYAGETLRIYTPKRGGRDQAEERDRRIVALAAEPSKLTPAQIAAREGITVRRVQQIIARGVNASTNAIVEPVTEAAKQR